MYNNEPLENVESFNYLGLKIPSINGMNVLLTAWSGGEATDYTFENICNVEIKM